MSAPTIDKVWSATDTTPGEIEHELTGLLKEIHAENEHYVPARVINLICIVDREWKGEIANRLRGVGRYHGSRTIVCAVSPRRTTLDATASIAAPEHLDAGEIGLLRETVVLECGEKHLQHLDSIVDPLVVPDLATCVWAPHQHERAVDSLLDLAQVVLTDSSDFDDARQAIARNHALAQRAYVVDLAWLRTTPWRERLATTFDPPRLRPELRNLSEIAIRHAPDSEIAGLLLAGWFASRLKWKLSPLKQERGGMSGTAAGPGHHTISIRLDTAPELDVRGLAGFALKTTTGREFGLARGEGGLRGSYRNRRGDERTWTILGASRGEPGILGEGIRQALLREQTYGPALRAAQAMLPRSGR
ncbi:MAG TPA: glucose-6-phosphate dehydrogenase assembly protein OpcA [Baekduia sp.]|nr:glucose-6-phosphate dehydrogenase assembly protein OpcA [Baekduia sp.]